MSRVTMVGAVGIGLMVAASSMSAQGVATGPQPPVVVVMGEGVVRAAPDQAWVQIGAESRSKNPRDAQAQTAEAMTAVQKRMASAGIPKDAVRTTGYDLQMEYDYVNGKQVPRGFVARTGIEVRVDDLARLGEVLDASVASGAATVSGLRFDLKQRTTIEREALQRAVADAMRRAEAAAAGASRTIDRVLRIEETPAPRSFAQPVMAMRGSVDERAVTPVAPGEIDVRAQVTVTAAIK